MQKDEVGGHVAHVGKLRNACKILFENSKSKTLLVRTKCECVSCIVLTYYIVQ
jgi:hypothetical protein